MSTSSGPGSVLRLFARHGKKYRGVIFFLVLATVVDETIRSIGLPYLAKLFFDAIANKSPGPVASSALTHVLW